MQKTIFWANVRKIGKTTKKWTAKREKILVSACFSTANRFFQPKNQKIFCRVAKKQYLCTAFLQNNIFQPIF